MPKTCQAPNCDYGCGSYAGPRRTMFRCDKEPRLSEWKRAIPRLWNKECKIIRICEAHFESRFIQRVGVCTVDGRTVEFPINHPKLIEGALPTIFPGLSQEAVDGKVSMRRTRSDKGVPRGKRLKVQQEQAEELEEVASAEKPVRKRRRTKVQLEQANEIKTYEEFRENVAVKFNTTSPKEASSFNMAARGWELLLDDGLVVLFKKVFEPSFRISHSIEFRGDMRALVWINGIRRELDGSDLVKLWSELENLLITVGATKPTLEVNNSPSPAGRTPIRRNN